VPFRFTIDSPRKISGLFPVFALLGLIFTPTNFFFYSGHGASGQIKCLLLVGLMTIALIYPFSSEGAGALVETELTAAGQAATPGRKPCTQREQKQNTGVLRHSALVRVRMTGKNGQQQEQPQVLRLRRSQERGRLRSG
jgi:hypothetical protein